MRLLNEKKLDVPSIAGVNWCKTKHNGNHVWIRTDTKLVIVGPHNIMADLQLITVALVEATSIC